jgi:hypothetical protein
MTHDGRRFTGRRHWTVAALLLFHGTVDGAGGIEFALDDGVVFSGRGHDISP